MEIYTNSALKPGDSTFEKMKRKKWTGWNFLVSGEWAESPMNQGNHYFYIANTSDKRYWAILNKKFPKRIIAVAYVENDTPIEEIAAQMLIRVREEGGDYILLEHRHGDIDFKKFWSLYRSQRER